MVEFVQFPDTWSEGAKLLADEEYAPNQNWTSVRTSYHQQGLVFKRVLSDEVAGLTMNISSNDFPEEAKQVLVRLAFKTSDGPYEVAASAAIRIHTPPEVLP